MKAVLRLLIIIYSTTNRPCTILRVGKTYCSTKTSTSGTNYDCIVVMVNDLFNIVSSR